MKLARFWNLVSTAVPNSNLVQKEVRIDKEKFSKIDDKDLIAFRNTFVKLLEQARTHELADVGLLLSGSMTDDGLELFNEWVITLGRERFDAAMKNPDSLNVFFESKLKKTNILSVYLYDLIDERQAAGIATKYVCDWKIKGKPCKSPKEFKLKFPKTSAKYIAAGHDFSFFNS